ncbi:MAG TPA: tetratricopeptide repeat protein [Candidatus Bathyarchaeia archaeon]|nr:tetratricopeptide repeat protein [Candidatus Bathyarchaeia archaeon]HLP49236.1 tetratricopeptide repeat protein [Candidatus Kapabacteria bacterium]
MDIFAKTKLIPSNQVISPERNSVFNLKEFISNNRKIFILLFFLVLITYFNSTGNEFVSDDVGAIKTNPNIAYLEGVFSSPAGIIQRSLYFFDAFTFGLHPSVFRITSNLIFHIANTFLVFVLLNIISKRKPLAVFAACLFAIHPILTEAVVWISASPYVQSTFFALLSIITYILFKNAANWKKYLPFILFLAALSCQQAMIVIPLLFVLYELIFEKNGIRWKRLMPYLLVLAICITIFMPQAFQRRDGSIPESNGVIVKYYNPLIQIPIVISSYFKLTIWPSALSFFPVENMSYVHATGRQYALYLSFFIILGIILWLSWKKNKSIFFWLSFFLISLIPTHLPIKTNWILGERYVYFGSVGLFAIIACFFDWMLKMYPRHKNFIHIVFATILIAFSIRTIIRNRDWKNELTLYIATQKTSPSGSLVYDELGKAYCRQGDDEKAIEAFKKSIEINQYDPYPHYDIAMLYSKNGQPDLAFEELKKTIALSPNSAPAYHYLAVLYEGRNEKDLAISGYMAAIDKDPKFWKAYWNLGVLYYNAGDYQDALTSMQKALETNSGSTELQGNLEIIKSRLNGRL